MKKLISMLLVLLLAFSIAIPAAAEEDVSVADIEYDFLVTDFGAIPNDGICDVAGIQAALDAAAAAGGGTVLMPDGEYTIASRTGTTHHFQLRNAPNVTLRGESQDGTIVKIDYQWANATTAAQRRTAYVMQFIDCPDLELAYFTIEGNNTPWYNQAIIRIENASHRANVHHMTIQNFPFDCQGSMKNVLGVVRGQAPFAIHVTPSANNAASNTPGDNSRPQNVRIENNTIRNISNKWNYLNEDGIDDWIPREQEDCMNGGAIRLIRVDYAEINDNYIDNMGRIGINALNGVTYVNIRRNIVTNTGVGKFDPFGESDGGHDHERGIGLDALAIEIWGSSSAATGNRSNRYIVIEDNDVDCWLSFDATSRSAVRRNIIAGKELRLWTAVESGGSEYVEIAYNVYTDNDIETGMTGLSTSNNGFKELHYFGHNTIRNIPMWAVNLHGFAEPEYARVSSIDRFYFYDTTIYGTREDDVGVHYLWNGHAVKFVNKTRNVTFDSCNFYDNDGYAFFIEGGIVEPEFVGSGSNRVPVAPGEWRNDGIYVVNSTFTDNRKGVFNMEDWPDQYTTTFEFADNNIVSGNGTKTGQGDALPENMPYASPPPVAVINAPAWGVAGQPVTFASGSYTNNGEAIPAENYLWDLDASYPRGGVDGVTFTYDKPGNYRVALLVWDSDGRGAIVEHVIRILPPDAVVGASNAKYVSFVETAKNSRVWVLSFDIKVTYADGSNDVVRYTINLNGNNMNQDGKYVFPAGHDLEGYKLIYDIKGNGSNIKDFRITS